MKIIALYANKPEDEHKDIILNTIKHLDDNNFSVYLYKSLFSSKIVKHLNKLKNIKYFSKKEEIENTNLFLSIGGDGTLLRAAAFIQPLDIPILGVNVGRLGFLADLSPDEIPTLAEIICNQKYDIEKRIMLEISFTSNNKNYKYVALNDVSIFKRETLGILNIDTFINNKFLNTYWSDGILIATPTGSTAYSLSLGGPIITPDNSCLIVSPMAPHNLTVRPIIIPDSSEVRLKVKSRDKSFNIAIDSKSQKLSSGTEIIIKKSDNYTQIAKPFNNNYFDTLRHKLMWGVDTRNY